MRLGQKSFIHFVSKIGATVAGFLATIYFARFLGADVLGTYFLVIAVFTWLKMFSTMGITKAVKKRISESENPDAFLTAGLVLQILSLSIISILILLFRNQLVKYTEFGSIEVLVLLLAAGSFFSLVTSVLVGERLTHIAGALDPIDRIARTVAQITLVILGFEVLGMILGYVIASILSVGIGSLYISTRLKIPESRHFTSLWKYAKFSWLNSVSGRTFASMDTIVLGFFVTSDLIGIYEIAWNLASVLAIFGFSLSQTIFPEISNMESNDADGIIDLAETGVAYAGLFLIPGLFGSIVLGDIVLSVYSQEFVQGYTILIVLVVARLVSVYMRQILNIIDALNKPKITFKINGVFVVANIGLNVVLVYLYGWIGAAVASVASTLIGFILAYKAIVRLTAFRFPLMEISKQFVSAGIMGVIIYFSAEALAYEFRPSLLLVPFGAIIYFGVMMIISRKLRSTVRSNLPR
jgi:O-antigen/teichoic acid export membrane protein